MNINEEIKYCDDVLEVYKKKLLNTDMNRRARMAYQRQIKKLEYARDKVILKEQTIK